MMGYETGIEWTEATWNPWVGCTKVSAGCANCYMYSGMERWGRNPTKVMRTKDPTFTSPLRWKKQRRIFVCSWSDFFHEEADNWREEAYGIMRETPQHTYLLLTKRPERIAEHLPKEPLMNFWIGTSVEDKKSRWRIDELRKVDVPNIKFLSCEPLLESLGYINLRDIDWVIAGGESGAKARPCELEWLRYLRNTCIDQNVKFFLKQLGGFPDKKSGEKAVLDGRRWMEMPEQDDGE